MKLGGLQFNGPNAGRGTKKRNSNKQVIFQNYDNNDNINIENEIEENINEEINNENANMNIYKLPKPRDQSRKVSNRRPKDIVNVSGSYTSLKDYEDKINEKMNMRISKDKLIIDGRRQSKSHVPAIRNPGINQKIFLNQPNEDERNNINKILMNQKEREKFENLISNNKNNKGLLNPLYGSSSNPIQLFNKAAQINKYGKIQLNPLNSNANLSNINSINAPPPLLPNKKYKLAQIQVKDY